MEASSHHEGWTICILLNILNEGQLFTDFPLSSARHHTHSQVKVQCHAIIALNKYTFRNKIFALVLVLNKFAKAFDFVVIFSLAKLIELSETSVSRLCTNFTSAGLTLAWWKDNDIHTFLVIIIIIFFIIIIFRTKTQYAILFLWRCLCLTLKGQSREIFYHYQHLCGHAILAIS